VQENYPALRCNSGVAIRDVWEEHVRVSTTSRSRAKPHIRVGIHSTPYQITMHRFCFILVILCWATAGLAEEKSSIKCPSPNGRFALRINEPASESDHPTAELIEKKSGTHIVDLGEVYYNHADDTILVWSADSRRVAYATRGNKQGEVHVYFWNGSDFDEIDLPEELPSPDIKFSKAAEAGGVKNYGGAVKPLRWLNSRELEMSSDSTMLSHVDERTYTGVVRFTLVFNKQHYASVHKIGKSKTTID
jgi:hypothetical protein